MEHVGTASIHLEKKLKGHEENDCLVIALQITSWPLAWWHWQRFGLAGGSCLVQSSGQKDLQAEKAF